MMKICKINNAWNRYVRVFRTRAMLSFMAAFAVVIAIVVVTLVAFAVTPLAYASFASDLCAGQIAYAEEQGNSATPQDDNKVNTQQSPDNSFIYDTPISDLASATSYYDNKTVQVEGEVIGDRVAADMDDGHCWITLTSLDLNTHTLAVYMTNEDASKIDTYGVYGKTGTRLQVRGTFHLACNQHQGISGLHAQNVNVVEPGSVNEQSYNPMFMILGFVLLGVGVALVFVYRYVKNRTR